MGVLFVWDTQSIHLSVYMVSVGGPILSNIVEKPKSQKACVWPQKPYFSWWGYLNINSLTACLVSLGDFYLAPTECGGGHS